MACNNLPRLMIGVELRRFGLVTLNLNSHNLCLWKANSATEKINPGINLVMQSVSASGRVFSEEGI